MLNSPLNLWEALGSVPEEELSHVVTKLFMVYEKMIEDDPEHKEAHHFFKHLATALEQTIECNLNRR